MRTGLIVVFAIMISGLVYYLIDLRDSGKIKVKTYDDENALQQEPAPQAQLPMEPQEDLNNRKTPLATPRFQGYSNARLGYAFSYPSTLSLYERGSILMGVYSQELSDGTTVSAIPSRCGAQNPAIITRYSGKSEQLSVANHQASIHRNSCYDCGDQMMERMDAVLCNSKGTLCLTIKTAATSSSAVSAYVDFKAFISRITLGTSFDAAPCFSGDSNI